MTIKINELIKIGTNINNYYERLIDLEILRQRRKSEFLRTINKLREQLDQENALINASNLIETMEKLHKPDKAKIRKYLDSVIKSDEKRGYEETIKKL